MKIMLVGDVVGRNGRKAFDRYTKELRQKYNVDMVIVNGENSAGGKGISRKSMDELLRGGADVITSGNHIWDNREVYGFIDQEPYLVRPANYPQGAPGKGWCIYPFRSANVAVINLSGRAFMPDMDCPFQKIEYILSEIGNEADIFVLDFHAETTSEKMAMGFYLDGRVQAGNLERGRLSEKWLQERLRELGYQDASQVLFLCVNTRGILMAQGKGRADVQTLQALSPDEAGW